MSNVQVFHTLDAGKVFAKSTGGSGFWLSSLHFSEGKAVAFFLPGSRAYELALAVVESERGSLDPAPSWFVAGFGTAVDALSVEPTFQAVEAGVWSKWMEFAGTGFDAGPDDFDSWEEYLAENGLPLFTGAAYDFEESVVETFLGD